MPEFNQEEFWRKKADEWRRANDWLHDTARCAARLLELVWDDVDFDRDTPLAQAARDLALSLRTAARWGDKCSPSRRILDDVAGVSRPHANREDKGQPDSDLF